MPAPASLIAAIQAGRADADRATQNAYIRARRPIVDAQADAAAAQNLTNSTDANTRANSADTRAAAAEGRAAENDDFTQQSRVFQRGAQLLDVIARKIDETPDAKPSDILATVPPLVLKAVKLDTPEAQAHFADVYDKDPSLLRTHAQAYGGGQKVKSSVAAKDKDGVSGFLQTFEDGSTHFVPGYEAKPTGAAGAFTIAGKRFDGQGNLITDESAALASLEGAKAASRTVGTAQGKNTAEDIAPSESATRDAANSFLDLRAKDAEFQRAAKDAISQIGPLSTGFAAGAEKVPGSPAYKLNAALDTMKAQLTLGGLMDLKAKSKNGASGLGALSDREGELIAALQGSLKAGQDAKTLQKNIVELQRVHAQRLQAQEKAFAETYGVSPDEGLHKGGRAPAAAGAVPDDIAAILAKHGVK